jgi:hypothetical protein
VYAGNLDQTLGEGRKKLDRLFEVLFGSRDLAGKESGKCSKYTVTNESRLNILECSTQVQSLSTTSIP